jgi:hypothetical protein
MKNPVFWDVTPCASFKNLRFGGIRRLNLQGGKNQSTRKNVVSNYQLKRCY